jgi:hypothetical protein
VGRVLVLSEADYLYGAGPLRLRVDRVDYVNPVVDDDERWYTVEGFQVSAAGVELQARCVLVRGHRLLPEGYR